MSGLTGTKTNTEEFVLAHSPCVRSNPPRACARASDAFYINECIYLQDTADFICLIIDIISWLKYYFMIISWLKLKFKVFIRVSSELFAEKNHISYILFYNDYIIIICYTHYKLYYNYTTL